MNARVSRSLLEWELLKPVALAAVPPWKLPPHEGLVLFGHNLPRCVDGGEHGCAKPAALRVIERILL